MDVYDIAHAVEGGAIVRIYYESRLDKVALDDAGKKQMEALGEEPDQDDLTATQKVKAKWIQLEVLVGDEKQDKEYSKKILWTHFEQQQDVFEGEGYDCKHE